MSAPLTEEETDFLRLVSLIIGVAPKAVRKYFDSIYPPSNWAAELQNAKKTLKKLRFKDKVLTASQWNTLFKQGSKSIDFDLTLMICLLRNISGITPPAGGFDVLPPTSDINAADDLARIKYYRNLIAHSEDSVIYKKSFEDFWNDISQAIERLGGIGFLQTCVTLKSAKLDMECYKDIVLNIKQSQDEKNNDLEERVQKMLEQLLEIDKRLKDPVPSNIRARIEQTICKWKTEDTIFVDTNSSKKLLKAIKKKNIITLTGTAGIGKSSTMRHVALQLLEDGYDVLPLKTPSEVLLYSVQDKKILFIFDDICGKYTAIPHEIEDWDRHSEDIKNCFFKSQMKMLSNCRLHVYLNQHFQILDIFTQCQFNMTDSKYASSVSEKRAIAQQYLSDNYTEQLSDKNIEQFDCFPLLCCMASKKDESEIIDFMSNPYKFFENELDQAVHRGNSMFLFSLSLVTFCNNNLKENLLDETIEENDNKLFDDIFVACGLQKCSRSKIKETLDSLLQSYIIKQEDSYCFIHQKVFDFVSSYLWKKMLLPCMLEHCSITFLCERVVLGSNTETNDEFYITLPPKFESKYFNRLLKEVNSENILDIFGCNQMKDETYRKLLLSYMQEMNDIEIKKLLNLSKFGITVFHLMCKFGYKDLLCFCLGKNVDVDGYDETGMTPLHIACKYEQEDAVNVLLANGANVNKHKHFGYTPLYEACKMGKIDIVRQLLKIGADPDLSYEQCFSPLLASSENGNIEIVKLLLEYKANINIQNKDGVAALHLACKNGHEGIVNILIQYNAEIDIKTKFCETPLYFACIGSNDYIIELLVCKNANVFRKTTNTRLCPLTVLFQYNKELLRKIFDKYNVETNLFRHLEITCENDDSKLVEAILATGININRLTERGETLLHKVSRNGLAKIAEILIDSGACVNQLTVNGASAIQLGCLKPDNSDIISILVSKNADINALSPRTHLPPPLHISCVLKEEEIVYILINNNADINYIADFTVYTMYEFRDKKYIDSIFSDFDSKTKFRTCPIEIAAMLKNVNLSEMLLSRGAAPNLKSDNGIPPLLIASFYGNVDLINSLLKYKANVNICNNIDGLCLANIQYGGDEDIVELFAHRKVEYTSSSVTALHLACMSGREDVAAILLMNFARTDILCNISPVLFGIRNGKYHIAGSKEQLVKSYVNFMEIENVLPLHLACFIGCASLVKTLVGKASSYDKESNVYVDPRQVACIYNVPIGEDFMKVRKRTFLLTPLQIACLGHHWNTCQALIDEGVDTSKDFDVSDLLIACFSQEIDEITKHANNSDIYKTSVVYLAYKSQAYDLVRKMLNSNFNVDIGLKKDFITIFHHACFSGNLDMVKYLVSKHPQLVIAEDRQRTPLHCACETNNIKVVDFFLSLHIDVDCLNINEETPLHIASKRGFTEIVLKLLRKGSNPFKLTLFGENAYHIACKYDQTDCISCLLQFTDEEIYTIYSDTVHCTNILTDDGKSLLYFAYRNKNSKIIESLIKFGADINLTLQEESLLFYACRDPSGQLDLLLQHSTEINARNMYGKTLICVSCESGHDEVTKKLLKFGADVNIESHDGYTPLYFACIKNNKAMAELLLKNGANPNACILLEDRLLINSCKNQAYSIVELLLRYGANISDHKGETVLYHAFAAGNVKMIETLLRYKADTNVCIHERQASLYYACENGMLEVVKLILNTDKTLDMNVGYYNENTPLYGCYQSLNKESKSYEVYILLGNLLLELGADVNWPNSENDTPFHQLCANGHVKDIQFVIGSNLVNKSNIQTEFVYACYQNNVELIKLFHKYYQKSIQPETLYTSWFSASKLGNTSIINYLVNLQFSVNAIDKIGDTALHFACRSESDELIDKLIDNNSDVNCVNKYGETPLLISICKRNIRNVTRLLEAGASVNNTTNLCSNGTKNCFKNAHFKTVTNISPLHIACILEDRDMVLKLIKFQSNYNGGMIIFLDVEVNGKKKVLQECMSPLFISVLRNNVNIVNLLLQSELDYKTDEKNTVLIMSLYKDYSKYVGDEKLDLTPFQAACISGSTAIVKSFINNHAANVDTTFMITPMLISVITETPLLMKVILNQNNFRDNDFKATVTPLLFSTLIGNVKMMKILLANFANPRVEASLCVIHLIALHREILKLLCSRHKVSFLDEKCSLNSYFITFLKNDCNLQNRMMSVSTKVTCSTELSALHVICIKGFKDHLQIILEKGIELNKPFFVEFSHIMLMSNDVNDNEDSDESLPCSILDYLNTPALMISCLQFSCFCQDVNLLKSISMMSIEENSHLTLSPFILMLWFSRLKQYMSCCRTMQQFSNVSTVPVIMMHYFYDDNKTFIEHIMPQLDRISAEKNSRLSQIVCVDDSSWQFVLYSLLGKNDGDDSNDDNEDDSEDDNEDNSEDDIENDNEDTEDNEDENEDDSKDNEDENEDDNDDDSENDNEDNEDDNDDDSENDNEDNKDDNDDDSENDNEDNEDDNEDSNEVDNEELYPYLRKIQHGICQLNLELISYYRHDTIGSSKLLLNKYANGKVLKLNLIYWMLMQNLNLKVIKFHTDSFRNDSFKYTALESIYLMQGVIPDTFIHNIEAVEREIVMPQIILACLPDNASNFAYLSRYSTNIDEPTKISILYLSTFFKYPTRDRFIREYVVHLDAFANINALHIACLKANKRILLNLLQLGCDEDAIAFLTPLHIPFIHQHDYRHFYDDLERKLKLKYITLTPRTLDVSSSQLAAVHILCFEEDINVLKSLLLYRCTISLFAKLSTLCLHFMDQEKILKIPVQENTIHAVSTIAPIHIVSMMEKKAFLKCLLTKMQNVDLLGSLHPLHISHIHSKNVSCLITPNSFFIVTALHISLIKKNENLMKTLLCCGANTDIPASLSMTLQILNGQCILTRSVFKPLHLACIFDNTAILKVILSKTTFIDQLVPVSLWHLCYFKVINVDDILSNLTHEVEVKLNVLHIACLTENCVNVKLLLEAGANPNIAMVIPSVYTQSNNWLCIRKYPLHLAAELGNTSICERLLEYGANSKANTIIAGLEPWHLALYHGHLETLKLLLSEPTDVKRSTFIFIFTLYLIRKLFSDSLMPTIFKSRKLFLYLSLYRYLMNIFGFIHKAS